MRILLSYVVVGRGGDAVQMLALARAMRDRGHTVAMAGGHELAPYAFATPGSRLRAVARRLPWWTKDILELGLGLAAARRAARACRTVRPDLIVHRPGLYDAVISQLADRWRIPLALYLDSHVEAERAFRRQRYWRALHRRAMWTLAQRATVAVVPSRAVAEYYARLGIAQHKIEVARNAVSERHLQWGADPAVAPPPLTDPDRCAVGFVGSLSRWHRVDLLLDALALLVRGQIGARRRYELVVVGHGEEAHALEARVAAWGLGAVVNWRGPMGHDDAVRAAGTFDVAVLPDTLDTGAPMKLAEYAAMGRPMVAPDRPNIRELFVPGQEITLVPPGDARALAEAIWALAQDPEAARRMAAAARARVLGCTWEALVDLLVARATASPP
ncbi:MAG: glycosyltransferase family 4 protein [Armatimonadota bacterium]|nr:glycosyltransferase family 4 protein [Armatimonadota bacterium]